MKASQTQNLVTKARKEFLEAAELAKDAGKSAQAATALNRQAKLKFKQAKKWARHTKKLAKKAEAEVVEAQQALQKAGESLKKAEKKALKGLKKVQAKTSPVKVVKPPRKRKLMTAAKPRPSQPILVPAPAASSDTKPASDMLDLSIINPVTPSAPPQAAG